MEEKVIPKRENQGLNGIGVSVFALIVLLIGVPVASAYLIDFALYFGGEEVEFRTTDAPQPAAYPSWINTGSNEDASRCTNESVDDLGTCPVPYTFASPRYFQGDIYHPIGGCENYSTAATISQGTSGFCGSDGYDLYQNITYLFQQNRTFPGIKIKFVGAVEYLCDPMNFGESKVDYVLKITRYTPTVNPAFFDKQENITFTGTSDFNNGGEFDYDETDMCNPTLIVAHRLSLSELNELEDIRREFMKKPSEQLIFLTIEMDNIETASGTPYDYANFYTPFQGGGMEPNYMQVIIPTYQVDAVNFTLKFGIFVLGATLWVLALASTPFWNPIKERFA